MIELLLISHSLALKILYLLDFLEPESFNSALCELIMHLRDEGSNKSNATIGKIQKSDIDLWVKNKSEKCVSALINHLPGQPQREYREEILKALISSVQKKAKNISQVGNIQLDPEEVETKKQKQQKLNY